MAFLFGRGAGGETPEERQQRRSRQEEDARRITAGGLPQDAEERLRRMAEQQGTPEHLFTGTLSVNELLLVRAAGFAPLGQVMGSSVGATSAPTSSAVSGELKFLSGAFQQIQERALERLRQEAALLGATGIVGVRLERRTPAVNAADEGSSIIEFAAWGTAVREISRPRPPRVDADTPAAPLFLSSLSGQEFHLLRRAGYRPLGLCLGNCFYYRVAAPPRELLNSFRNISIERSDYTDAVYKARRAAVGRMEDQAAALKATGIIDVMVSVQHRLRESGNPLPDLACHFFAVGTAIAPLSGSPSSTRLDIGTSVPMDL